MNRALGIILQTPKRAPRLIRCDETGEVATLTEWATAISSQRGARTDSVKALLSVAICQKKKAYGLTFSRVEATA